MSANRWRGMDVTLFLGGCTSNQRQRQEECDNSEVECLVFKAEATLTAVHTHVSFLHFVGMQLYHCLPPFEVQHKNISVTTLCQLSLGSITPVVLTGSNSVSVGLLVSIVFDEGPTGEDVAPRKPHLLW